MAGDFSDERNFTIGGGTFRAVATRASVVHGFQASEYKAAVGDLSRSARQAVSVHRELARAA